MSIPINTTLITVLRTGEYEPYETPPEPTVVASKVRAHISTSQGTEVVAGGSQSVVTFRMSCDPVDLTHLDQVRDETTGEMYEVSWVHQRRGLGLDHTQAGLRQVHGVVSTPRLVTQ